MVTVILFVTRKLKQIIKFASTLQKLIIFLIISSQLILFEKVSVKKTKIKKLKMYFFRKKLSRLSLLSNILVKQLSLVKPPRKIGINIEF